VSLTTALCEPALESRALFLDARSHEGTRALARELLMMDAPDYPAVIRGSAIKRPSYGCSNATCV
jgi:hypothetical protein